MTCGRGVPFATFAVLAVVLVACGVSRPSRLTVENRTRADVVIVTGYDWATRLFVPACGQAVLELGEGAQTVPSPPPDANPQEVRYQFPTLPDAATIATFTITSERIWTGTFASPPPCAGDAPTSSE